MIVQANKKDEDFGRITTNPLINIVKGNELNTRDLAFSSNETYFVSCAEMYHSERPHVLVWRMKQVAKKGKHYVAKLEIEGEFQDNEWLLCVDVHSTRINGMRCWMICAGSILGNLYVWKGPIEPKSKKWIFEECEFKKITLEDESIDARRAISKVKILKKRPEKCELILALNDVNTISNDKKKPSEIFYISLLLKAQEISIQQTRSIGVHDDWILSLDTRVNEEKTLIFSGSKDKTVRMWDLDNGTNILIGTLDDDASCVKVFEMNSKLMVAASCIDNSIVLWDISSGISGNFKMVHVGNHEDEVVWIDYQQKNGLLVSASKDNLIRFWDIQHKMWIREIDTDEILKQEEIALNQREFGLNYLRMVIVSPSNKYVLAIKKNKIVILRNFGRVWHFYQQLKFVEKNNKELFNKIYGKNLKQIVKHKSESEESLREIYAIIKERLLSSSGTWNPRKLGPLFVPSFVTFDESEINQKEYLTSVQSTYESYWYSVKNMFFKEPEMSWNFKLYLSTDLEEDVSNFIEITNNNHPHIILDDRKQSQLRFVLILDNVPTTFIPLLNAIEVEVESDRGDKDSLDFSDFAYFTKPKAIQVDRKKLISKNDLFESQASDFYYSECIFKIDGGYATEKFAAITIKKISLEFAETLNPMETKKKNIRRDLEIFEAFRKNFKYPLIQKITVQIGKGFKANLGKIGEEYLSSLIALEFIFTLIDVISMVGYPGDILTDPLGIFLYALGIIGFGLFTIMMFIIFFRYKSKSRGY
ncbi:MAG: hypothetical protein JW891_13820 [Candidatus Lokiarchaeota archaeon]|nr:hypothetical protein [Candidatus Lokiarchaeota archaeon]